MKDMDAVFQKVECPFCGAKVEEPCRTKKGQFTEWSHKARQDAAQAVLGISLPGSIEGIL